MLWLKELNPKTLTDQRNQASIDFCLCKGLQKTTLAVPSCPPGQPFLPPCSTHSWFLCVCFSSFTQRQLFQSFFHHTPTMSSFFTFSGFNFLPFFLPSSILLYFCLTYLYLLLLSASFHSSEQFHDLIVCYYCFLSIYGVFFHSYGHCPSSSAHLSFWHISPSLALSLPSPHPALPFHPTFPRSPIGAVGAGVRLAGRVLHMSHTQDGRGWICWPTM